MQQYQEYTTKVRFNRLSSPIVSYQNWCAPSEGWIKLNFDAHVGDNIVWGIGAIARDHNGNVLYTGTRRCTAL